LAADQPKLGVHRTTFQPVWLLIQDTAGNGQTAYPEKIYNSRNSLRHFARIVSLHLGIATFHGHFFAHWLVFTFLHDAIFGLFFATRVIVAIWGAYIGMWHFVFL